MPCKHKCRDKEKCGHACCKEGFKAAEPARKRKHAEIERNALVSAPKREYYNGKPKALTVKSARLAKFEQFDVDYEDGLGNDDEEYDDEEVVAGFPVVRMTSPYISGGKFWKIEMTSDITTVVSFGKLHSKGEIRRKIHKSAQACARYYRSSILSKKSKGYH